VTLHGFLAHKRVCHTCCDPIECTAGGMLSSLELNEAIPQCPRRG
jgi:cysteine synthase A